MRKRADRFDAESVRDSWDRAASPYAQGQALGRDFYRYEFFGPAQVALCGDVSGMSLLDIGCGNGYFSREMARGGARVTGIDISPRMIEHAKHLESLEPLGIQYRVMDATELPGIFARQSFDMATCCLALENMPDVEKVFQGVRQVLRPGGRFVASIAHPCTDTPFRSWECDSTGRKTALCIDRYFERGPLQYEWNGWGQKFTTGAIHAPLEDWFGWILQAGFQCRSLHEPRPTEEAIKARPELEDATRVPYYLVFDLIRPSAGPT